MRRGILAAVFTIVFITAARTSYAAEKPLVTAMEAEEWQTSDPLYEELTNIFYSGLNEQGKPTDSRRPNVEAAEQALKDLKLPLGTCEVHGHMDYMAAFLQNCGGMKNQPSLYGGDIYIKRARRLLPDGKWDHSAPYVRIKAGTTPAVTYARVRAYLLSEKSTPWLKQGKPNDTRPTDDGVRKSTTSAKPSPTVVSTAPAVGATK